ncbi:MAG: LysR family transcriptional regulator [Gemmataceae bacterium]|nr:LysR family transcriptional regulator [Gemmataceae bacterium]
MARTSTRRRSHAPALAPRLKVWLESAGHYVFGLGICEILEAVDRVGSIKQAASDLGKSYRYVWGRLKEAQQALGQLLVEARVGGRGAQRSSLTPEARQLVTAFRELRGRMQSLLDEEFARLFP